MHFEHNASNNCIIRFTATPRWNTGYHWLHQRGCSILRWSPLGNTRCFECEGDVIDNDRELLIGKPNCNFIRVRYIQLRANILTRNDRRRITSTYFQEHQKWIWTWKRPGGEAKIKTNRLHNYQHEIQEWNCTLQNLFKSRLCKRSPSSYM